MLKIVFYQERDGSCPVLNFLRKEPRRVRAKARDRIWLLGDRGHTLRRPYVDYLRDDIHELRWAHGRVQYRILYFFFGQETIVLAHTLTKEGEVPDRDIDRAVGRKQQFISNPKQHTYQGEISYG